jgi:hypothetical protein
LVKPFDPNEPISTHRIQKENDVSISIIGKKVKYLKNDLMEIGVRPDVKSWITSVSDGDRFQKNCSIPETGRRKDARCWVSFASRKSSCRFRVHLR